jgi:hypothetical protein
LLEQAVAAVVQIMRPELLDKVLMEVVMDSNNQQQVPSQVHLILAAVAAAVVHQMHTLVAVQAVQV